MLQFRCPAWQPLCRDMAAVIARLQASIAAKTAEAASEVAAEAEGVAEAAVAELEAIVEEEVGTPVPAYCVPSCCCWQTLFAIKAVIGLPVSALMATCYLALASHRAATAEWFAPTYKQHVSRGTVCRCCLQRDAPPAGHRGSCKHSVRALKNSKCKATSLLAAADAGGPCHRW